MNPRYLVLSIVANCPEEIVPGRTVLRKLGYFCSTILNLGVTYRPHFFGPYAASMADAADRMEALGYIVRTYIGVGGSTRRDYHITREGRTLCNTLEETQPEAVKIAKLMSLLTTTPGWDNVKVISSAAKVDLILRRADRPMDETAIAQEARDLGCKLDEEDIGSVVAFLVSVGLAKVAG